ncbi:MAG: hypothetical protein L0H31_09670, partial [Nocardioidaceae bacterium]|nr:hypothetical protein [Nocardioidaceae bacterium]
MSLQVAGNGRKHRGLGRDFPHQGTHLRCRDIRVKGMHRTHDDLHPSLCHPCTFARLLALP